MKQRIGISMAIVAVLLILVQAWRSQQPAAVFGSVYAYDIGTGHLFATTATIPPMAAPSGSDRGVIAHVVRFAGDNEPTVVYLSTYTPEARRLLLEAGQFSEAIAAGMLVRRPEDTTWTPARSPAGRAISARVSELAAGRTWTVVLPPASEAY